MVDIDTIVRGLEYCVYDVHDGDCNPDCPYYEKCSKEGGVPAVLCDALQLLKKTDVIVKRNANGWRFYYCPNCGEQFVSKGKSEFCPFCGKVVNWGE